MTDHCIGCQIARELRTHRDTTHPLWSPKRGALSFAVVVAERACPAYPETNQAASVAEEADHG